MAEAVLDLLLRQTAVLSLALPLLLLLRQLLVRHGGAALAYAVWGLLPLLMLVASLPGSAPGQVLAGTAWARHGPMPQGAAQHLPLAAAGADVGTVLLVLWASGVSAGALRLTLLQRRYARRLRRGIDGAHWWAPAGEGPALVGWSAAAPGTRRTRHADSECDTRTTDNRATRDQAQRASGGWRPTADRPGPGRRPAAAETRATAPDRQGR